MKTLFLVWHQPGQRWWPVGRLSRPRGFYAFVYTRGVRLAGEAGFRPLVGMPELDAAYVSETLFPLFANRLYPKGRREYTLLPRWADLPSETQDPLVVLGRTLGPRVTDTFEVFGKPEPDERQRYSVALFAHGLAHLSPEARARAQQLEPDELLTIEHDPTNRADPAALKILTSDGAHVGFVPRYLCGDIHELQRLCDGEPPRLTVRRVNADAPPQFLLLCTLSARWPAGFAPCSGEEYQTLNPEADRILAELDLARVAAEG